MTNSAGPRYRREIVNQPVESAACRGCQDVWIDVISGHEPVRQLFISGGRGCAAHKLGEFQLSRVVLDSYAGDPSRIAAAALGALHRGYSSKDAVMEKLPARSPCWTGFRSVGYFEAFRRLEIMKRLC